jgi:EAL domain-containing protein (putative c-di-GMP-specific phosphodiesterase class I)
VSNYTLEEVRKIGERHGLAMLPVLHKPFRLQEFNARLDKIPSSAAVSTAEELLSVALRNNWLEVWYQPKVDLKSMQIRGAEALIRLRHPDRGILPPSAFLPPPGNQLYQPLTDFVVRRALADWSSMAAAQSAAGGRVDHRFAVNVPASVLRTREFIDNVLRHLPSHPQFPGLMVEITEDEAIADPELAREITIQLKLHNILVSIDDFGSGHSSLERLIQIPFAELKLDRSFVDGCSVDKRKYSICQNVVGLAHRGRMMAVAEGVENADDLQTLIGMGYDMAQGFFLAKPMQWEAVVGMLASSQPINGSESSSRAAKSNEE